MRSTDTDFAEFVAARWPSMVRSAIFLGCSRAEAEDIAQVTLVRCYASWWRVRRADDRDAYVYRMLLNCLSDSRRRFWNRETPTDVLPDPGTPDPTAGVDLADAVHRALAGLSQSNREAVVLRHLVGLTEQQTAEVLGIAVGSVKSRTSRGLTQLAADPNLSGLSGWRSS